VKVLSKAPSDNRSSEARALVNGRLSASVFGATSFRKSTDSTDIDIESLSILKAITTTTPTSLFGC